MSRRRTNHKTSIGIAEITLVIIIIALAAAGMYVYQSQQAENAISQSFVSWSQAGSEVETAKVNVPVTLSLDFYSNTFLGFTGQVVVKIRKDIELIPDETVASKTIMLSIPMGIKEKQRVNITFTPNVETSTTTREYFYKILAVDGTPIYDPTEPGGRNGLKVGSKAAGGTVPAVTGVLFNDRPQIEVAAGTSIITKIRMSGTGKGTLKMEVRKDITLLPDESYATLSREITFAPGEEGTTDIIMPAWNANAQGFGFREYFVRVYWNGDLIYDPTDPTQREYVKITSSSTGGSGGSSGGGSGGGTGSLTLKSVVWTLTPNGYSTAKTTFHATGAYDGVITVDIRKDVSLWADENLAAKQHTIKAQDSDITVETPFTAPASGSWVFVRATPNIYDLTDPATRKAQNTEVQVPVSGGGGTQPTPTTPPGQTPQPTPINAIVSYNIIEEISATARGTRINVPQGASVDVYATVSSSTATSGTLSVEVRRDFEWASDDTFTTLTKPTSLNAGTNTILVGSFTANDLTGSNNFRQYFFKPRWNGAVLNNPTDPSTREAVTTYRTSTPPPATTPQPTPGQTSPPPVQQGTATITAVGFTTGTSPAQAITVNKWQNVNVYALVRASGTVSGSVKIEVRKDFVALPDASAATMQKSFTLNNVEQWIYVGTFSPDESTSFVLRQYFARADLNADGSWDFDPTDPNTRANVKVN